MGGTIVVSRAKLDPPGIPFLPGILVASLLSLFLKLNAVVCQQKGFGEGLGKNEGIKMAVGVHTPTIRAIEKILKKTGITIEKVCILCGGPDWPTSVLTGILRLSCPQMLLGTLPMFFLIAPAVACGMSAKQAELRKFSSLFLVGVAVSQGMMFMAAGVFIARTRE